MSNNLFQPMLARRQVFTSTLLKSVWIATASSASLAIVLGCSRTNPILGEWRGEVIDRYYTLTVFSDGSGDLQEQGLPPQSLSWKPVGQKYEFTTGTLVLRGTLRENGTLALQKIADPDQGILIMRKVAR